ncbi:hypothetical protein FM996_18380 [Methylosinus sporium]|uniref:Uncharacterized protein n=1 Tax=Methylosinus sporium TaxID=428 RepID=A0A549SFV8_METSR|nr:hypothetical protein [Methylosinus sporium]TRL28499.1 hypothetical protein FM996_18380 [Methylosinus sporium]
MQKKTERVLGLIARPANRSALFWWMLENHDRIAEASSGTRMDWRGLCAEFAALGMGDTTGKPVSEANARKTWFRARREKQRRDEATRASEAARTAAAEVRKNYPSRQPTDLRPMVATNGAASSVASGAGGGRALALPKAGAPGVREGLVRHPIEPQRAVQQRVAAEADIRTHMSEIGEDGRLTPRAIELTMAWSGMQARRADKWTGVAQGLLVLEDEVILVEFETARRP